MQVEGVAAGRVVGDDRLVHVHRTLRRARRAAGEVQQRRVLRSGRGDLLDRLGPLHQVGQVEGAGLGAAVGVDKQDVPEVGQVGAHRGDLLAVQGSRGEQHPPLAEAQPLGHRLGAERGEERAEHAAVLERPEHADEQVGAPAEEGEDALAAADAERPQHTREA
jgi:hypothetical protein